ncbi:MAG: hypothetical protein H5U21_02135 [Porphyrobacter sp.]|nr:hypothetical protein [Porphyrobacter sp.]
MGANKLPARLTDQGARRVRKAARAVRGGASEVPGPSPNPATNLLIADIAMRSASMLLRRSLAKGLLSLRYDPDTARQVVQGRTMGQTMISAAAARLATRSVPGFLLVSGGLLAKSVLDRSRRRRSRQEGEKTLRHQVADAPEDSDEPI